MATKAMAVPTKRRIRAPWIWIRRSILGPTSGGARLCTTDSCRLSDRNFRTTSISQKTVIPASLRLWTTRLKLSMCGVPVRESNKANRYPNSTLHLEVLRDGAFERYWISSFKLIALCRGIQEFQHHKTSYHAYHLPFWYNVPTALLGAKMWSESLKNENRLKAFKKNALRWIL